MTHAEMNGNQPSTIRLEGVTKTYPGSEDAAVEALDLDVPQGEIVVLVGPSGCGKSTTLRLINRMIEPTSGRIYFEGDDVTKVNADHLRRRIGYVIQQVGLFPHQTIAQNIATVPKLLGWDKDRIRDRVDELLDMVGMPAAEYRSRYPRELSGGQAQRVGVARALGGDPAVLLMDEPFGAIDPITRERLQNEFLRLQADLKKTIVFVTHDIDEAIKMGDRIAVLRDRSQVAQFDTPERILAHPMDDFVEDFIGSGSTLKGLNFERVRDAEPTDFPLCRPSDRRSDALTTLRASREKWMLVMDADDRPMRWVDEDDLERADRPLDQLGTSVTTIEPAATLRDALEEMLLSSSGQVVVVDGRGRYQGVVAVETLTDRVRRMREAAQRHYEELRVSEPDNPGTGAPVPADP
jgi:osmoprotectant transport system ATP-binding protein